MELDLYAQSLLWAFGLSLVFGAIARNKATASSCPGSQSMMILLAIT